MSLCNTYRSFAIYLLIVILTSESPISAFTIRRMRTTTLRSADFDLAGEESALLEVKSDLSKLNNERDYVKYGTRKSPIGNSANILGADKKFPLTGSKNIIQPTTVELPNENVTKPPENRTVRNDTETTTYPIFGKGDILKTIAESTTDAAIKKYISVPNSSSQSYLNGHTSISGTDDNLEGRRDNESRNTPQNVNDNDYSSISTERSEADSSGTDETQILNTEITTAGKPEEVTTEIVTGNFKDYRTDAEPVKEEDIIYKTINLSTTQQTDTTEFQTDSTKFNDVEKDSTATDSTTFTKFTEEVFSSSSSKDPSWKKYTIIERKRTNPTTEADSSTTETSDELENAESISTKVTLANIVSPSTLQSHQELLSDTKTTVFDTEAFNLSSSLQASSSVPETETEQMQSTQPLNAETLQPHQEHLSDRKTTDVKTEAFNSSSTLQAFSNIPETETVQMPSTRPLNAETTTEVKSQDSLTSRRAGFLDISTKQNTDETSTTELFEDIKYNETELFGSMFEIDTQDNDIPELKNSTMAESQSQLADDAIKEELMKEAVLSDHEENSKRYNEEQQDLNKVKPLNVNTDDSLSVKPIGKGGLYTSRSNYKPMKKIEVQPLKPYVRDPDDNSWRNESLSYLGIVFKAKNASKPFTQVLRNKTEAELNNWSERDNKNEVPELRERLEKIAEVRKSKKKKLNQFGEMVYSDYEAESSGEISSTPKTDTVSIPVMDVESLFFENPPTTSSTQRTTTPGVYMYKEETVATTKKPKKMKFAEYYDTTDEYDADYLSLSKIDLKKFTTRLFGKDMVTTPPPIVMFTKSIKTMMPDRKPTLQYFPPRDPLRREPQKVNVNDYDNDFQKKVNMFAYSEPPRNSPISFTPPPATMDYKTTQYLKETSVIQGPAHQYKPANLAKNVYVTFPPRVVDHNKYRAGGDESFNRASYVIKHFKDLIDEAVKDNYDKNADFMQPYTEPPLTGVTIKKDQLKSHMDDDYDYDANLRKDVLTRFVDNFNQNSERFKVDFPVLYNSSVVHMQADDNGKVVASSSAFLKRQYGEAPGPMPGRPCCDMKVELSPAYELHYYVPDQEENEEAEKPATMPFSYRL